MTSRRRDSFRTIAGMFLGCSASGVLRGQFAGSPRSDAEMEKFILGGTIVAQEEIGHGVTHPIKVTLRMGSTEHAAKIQVVDKELPPFFGADNKAVPMHDSWRFNVAAYRLDRLLELRMATVAVSRRFNGKPAGFSWWVDDVMFEEAERLKKGIEPPDPENFARQLAVARVFDELIINIDRNYSNLLITKSWHVALIDHSRSFNRSLGIRNKENLTRCSRLLMANMRALTVANVTKACGTSLTKEEVNAVIARRDRIVEFFENAAREKGEDKVYFS